jgi:hypothetical protein
MWSEQWNNVPFRNNMILILITGLYLQNVFFHYLFCDCVLLRLDNVCIYIYIYIYIYIHTYHRFPAKHFAHLELTNSQIM